MATNLEGSTQSYLSNLNKYFNSDFLKSNIKKSQNGIFVNLDIIDIFIENFEKHLFELTGTYPKKDFHRNLKKIFGHESPSVNYLIEGKNTLVGYLIPTEQTFNNLISVNLSTLDTKSYLHPRDPILSSTNGLSGELTNSGLIFTYKNKSFNLEILKSFQTIVSDSKILTEKYPDTINSLRIALIDFTDFLSLLRKPNCKVLIPDIKGNILAWNKIIVIIENSNIKKIYNLRGNSFNEFLDSILVSFRNKNKQFTQFKSNNIIGRFEMVNRDFLLTYFVLNNFIKDNFDSNLKYLKFEFNIQDVIDALQKLLTTADQVSFKDLPFKGFSDRNINYYTNLGWYFAVNPKKEIIGITTKFFALKTKPQPKL